MENELVNICLKKIKIFDEEISSINKNINKIKPIYDKLCPKGKPFDKDDDNRILKICDDNELTDKMCSILEENCPFLLLILLKNQKKYDDYCEYTDKELLKRGLSKELIYDKVWGMDSDIISNNLEAYLSFIRKKLKLINSNVQIKALRNLGYKMEYKDEGIK